MLIYVKDTPNLVVGEINIAFPFRVFVSLSLALLGNSHESLRNPMLRRYLDLDPRVLTVLKKAMKVLRLGFFAFANNKNVALERSRRRSSTSFSFTIAAAIRHLGSISGHTKTAEERDGAIAALQIAALEIFRFSGNIIG
jgi:hypothetical protein